MEKSTNTEIIRCPWPGSDPTYLDYHDKEWGVPSFDDAHIFELLILEGAQAGLSWITVLRKRESYRKAFDSFSPEAISKYDEASVNYLMNNPGIIRNRRKIESSIANARSFIKICEKHGSFSDYIWRYVEGKPIVNRWNNMAEVPALTPLSEQISRDLKKNGFNFVGPTIIYSFMQAIGMVNDHLISCFRHQDCQL